MELILILLESEKLLHSSKYISGTHYTVLNLYHTSLFFSFTF